MRISWSECLAWHGLWLLPQGTGRSLGRGDLLLCRGDMGRMEVPHTTAGRPQAPALTGARAARSQPLHLQKHSGSFRLGTREDFLSFQERIFPSRIWDCLLVRAKQGLSEGLLWWVQLYWLIAREGSARQLFCSGLHPLKLSFNYCCCHSDQVLLCLYLLIPLCVPALNLAFTFRSAVLHRDDSKEYEEKATTCHLVHLPAQWWLRFEWNFFSPFPLPFKGLFDLYLFTSLSD